MLLYDARETTKRDGLYFLPVGSKNQDPRGAYLDGELSHMVAGLWALVEYPDFLYLMANTEWIEEQEQSEELITVEESGARKFGRAIRTVL